MRREEEWNGERDIACPGVAETKGRGEERGREGTCQRWGGWAGLDAEYVGARGCMGLRGLHVQGAGGRGQRVPGCTGAPRWGRVCSQHLLEGHEGGGRGLALRLGLLLLNPLL